MSGEHAFAYWPSGTLGQKREYALTDASSSPSLQNTRSRGVAGSTSRGWRLVGLGEEMVRFRGGGGWV